MLFMMTKSLKTPGASQVTQASVSSYEGKTIYSVDGKQYVLAGDLTPEEALKQGQELRAKELLEEASKTETQTKE